ncbi:hypothetical protein GO986_15115 [Deinococcus sp. HMF7620]|uniref:Uncharacterized protein n=1 Tax=Deinococcus arboris TaxID=2682977 RepID=A0A7C9LSD5_9DEIO|nr:hypothetical protein [Deinococcus arboris]MVN88081.1 hypothetical protein [Deinococcus arboris]
MMKGPWQLAELAQRKVTIHRLSDVIAELRRQQGVLRASSGSDLFDLLTSGESTSVPS